MGKNKYGSKIVKCENTENCHLIAQFILGSHLSKKFLQNFQFYEFHHFFVELAFRVQIVE